jgi:hypothetical protein
MVDKGREFNVFAGSVFIKGLDIQRIEDRKKPEASWKIGIPYGYFKIVIDVKNNISVCFLFDHQVDVKNGCNIDSRSVKSHKNCIVPIEYIEDVTGLTFFY